MPDEAQDSSKNNTGDLGNKKEPLLNTGASDEADGLSGGEKAGKKPLEQEADSNKGDLKGRGIATEGSGSGVLDMLNQMLASDSARTQRETSKVSYTARMEKPFWMPGSGYDASIDFNGKVASLSGFYGNPNSKTLFGLSMGSNRRSRKELCRTYVRHAVARWDTKDDPLKVLEVRGGGQYKRFMQKAVDELNKNRPEGQKIELVDLNPSLFKRMHNFFAQEPQEKPSELRKGKPVEADSLNRDDKGGPGEQQAQQEQTENPVDQRAADSSAEQDQSLQAETLSPETEEHKPLVERVSDRVGQVAEKVGDVKQGLSDRVAGAREKLGNVRGRLGALRSQQAAETPTEETLPKIEPTFSRWNPGASTKLDM